MLMVGGVTSLLTALEMSPGYPITFCSAILWWWKEEQALQIQDVQLEVVKEFNYLGFVIHHEGLIQSDVEGCVVMASCAFGRLRIFILKNKSLTTLTKHVVYVHTRLWRLELYH